MCLFIFSVRHESGLKSSVPMSLLAPGTRCSSCTLVDFLPLLCPSCDLPFCPNHIYIHQPCSSLGSTSYDVAVGKLDRGKKTCEKEGCERETIESVAGVPGRDEGEGIAREVKCEGCGGAFCTSYVTIKLHMSSTIHLRAKQCSIRIDIERKRPTHAPHRSSTTPDTTPFSSAVHKRKT